MLRPRLHGASIAPFIAQILDSYEVTQSKIAQIKVILFAHVNKALGLVPSVPEVMQPFLILL